MQIGLAFVTAEIHEDSQCFPRRQNFQPVYKSIIFAVVSKICRGFAVDVHETCSQPHFFCPILFAIKLGTDFAIYHLCKDTHLKKRYKGGTF